jgi:NADH-quinone oxidoreductase subunit H
LGRFVPSTQLDCKNETAWFFAKLFALICLFIWVRGTLPRLRMDQLMNFAWKFMLPMALINIGVAAMWKFMPPGPGRWVLCALLIVVPYVTLGRALSVNKAYRSRVYRYAG